MFNTAEIARQSLQRAEEIRARKKSVRCRAAIISGACASGLGAFFLMFSTGMLPGNGDPAVIDIDEPRIPLAASPIETQTESNGITCSVYQSEADEEDEYDYLE